MADIKRESDQEGLDASQNRPLDNKVYDILVEKKKQTFSEPIPESRPELSVNEKEPQKLEGKSEIVPVNKIEEQKIASKPEISSSKQTAASFYQEQLKEIDGILAEGLHEVFLKMNSQKQQEFKKAGEDAALKISTLLQQAKVSVDKIISLIKKWLQIIPGINQFFLEQEAKIKADKIIKLKNKF